MKRHLALTAAAHAVPAAAVAALGHPALALVLYALAVAAFVPLTNAYLRGDRLPRWRTWVDGPYFVGWAAGLLAIPFAFVAAMFAPLGRALGVAYGAALVVAAYGWLVRRRLLELHRLDVRLDDLQACFDGYRIAHVSDLHIGPFTSRSDGMRWARAVNRVGCDLVVVTGDLIQTGDAFLDDAADVVGALRAPDGVVFVMGNHDYYGDATRLVALLEARRVRVLRNRSERIRGLLVAGVDHGHRGDMDAALAARQGTEPTVLLAHDPDRFDEAAARHVDVVLSGHTHGGQLALPFFARHLNLARLRHRRSLGHYRSGRSQLVVHPGLGTSGPPVRIGVPPTILELTLRAA